MIKRVFYIIFAWVIFQAKIMQNRQIVEMSSSWNFPARASLSYEGSEPSQAGALQFSSWNQADNTDNMYVKKLQIFTLT